MLTVYRASDFDHAVELVKNIRHRTSEHYIYIILLTGKSDKSDIVTGIEAGADDFLSKPFDKNELNARLNAGIRVIELERNLAERNAEISLANTRMKTDLDAAANLQKSLLPTGLPTVPSVELFWDYYPCDELAGDILDVCFLDDEHIALYVLDVSGHGL